MTCCCPKDCTGAPTVTCSISSGDFNYTISDAKRAWYREYCPPNEALGGTHDTETEITLTDGAASGSISSIDPLCHHCIYATNDCGETYCCKDCEEVTCAVKILLPGESPNDTGLSTTVPAGQIGVYWQASHQNPITTLELNGVAVTDQLSPSESNRVAGVKLFTIPVSDSSYCLEVITNCGVRKECCIAVPCCMTVSDRVYEFRNLSSVYYQKCTYTPIVNSFSSNIKYVDEIWVRNLDGLNGTNLVSLRTHSGQSPISCDVDIPHDSGVTAEVEIRTTATITYDPNTDPCGASWVGFVTKEYRLFRGKVLFGQRGPSLLDTILILEPTHEEYIVAKAWDNPSTRAPCRSDSRKACTTGTDWSEDSDYCLVTNSSPADSLDISIADMQYGCEGLAACDQVPDWCPHQILPSYIFGVSLGVGCDRAYNASLYSKVCSACGPATSCCGMGSFDCRVYHA